MRHELSVFPAAVTGLALVVSIFGCVNPEDEQNANADMSTSSSSTTTPGSSTSGTTTPTNTNMTVASDMGGGADMSCDGDGEKTVCVSGEPRKVYNSDRCGNPTTVKTTCASALSCEVYSDGQADCACPLTGKNRCRAEGGRSTLYEPTNVVKERTCENPRPEPDDFIESCGFGTVCFQEDGFDNGVAACRRSVDESQSNEPYYDFSCGTFSEWLRHPTKLEIDCRCRTTGDGQGGAGGTGNALADPNNVDITKGGRPGGSVVNCGQPSSLINNVWPVDYGKGPSYNAWFQQNNSGASWFSGVLNPDTREMFALIRWTNPQYSKSATLVSWNIDTKDRRIVSGLHPDPQLGQKEYGSGYLSPRPAKAAGDGLQQPLTGASVVRLSADKKTLYTFGGGTGEGASNDKEIVRIDPTTGARELVWKSQNDKTSDLTAMYGQCFRPDALGGKNSVAFNAQAFDVGPDGTFYLSMRGVREGDGLVTISPDGKQCNVYSRWGGQGHSPGGGATPEPAPDQIGTGFILQFPVFGLLWHEGLIYGVSNSEMYSFNPTTGQRIKVTYVNTTYSGVGFSNMFWDPSREVIWAVGTTGTNAGAIVDLKTGRKEGIYADTGRMDFGADAILNSVYQGTRSIKIGVLGNGHSIGRGGVVLDPKNPDIVYAVLKVGALMKLELSTFNSYVYSW